MAAKDKASEDNSSISAGPRFEVLDVLASIGSIADNQKFVRGLNALESFDHQVRVVLGFQTRDVEHVPVRLYAPSSDHWIGTPFNFSAVGDHGGRSPVFCQ